MLCKQAKLEMQSKLRDNNRLVDDAIEQLDVVNYYSCTNNTDISCEYPHYAERKKSAIYYDFKQILDSVKNDVESSIKYHA